MALKIKPEDFAVLKEAVEKVVRNCPNAAEKYREAGLTHKRYRWDVLHASGLKVFGDGMGMPGDLTLYSYMNDEHIDSALRAILGSDYPAES